MRGVVLIVVSAGLLAGAPSLAAVGRLGVPRDGALRSSNVAQVGFALPAGWVQSRVAMEGTPRIGVYESRTELEPGQSCTLRIAVSGATRRAVQPLAFAVVSRGRVRAGGRWLAARLRAPEPVKRGEYVSPTIEGAARLATPAWVTDAVGRPATGVRVSLASQVEHVAATPTASGYRVLHPSARQRRWCAGRARAELPKRLRAVLRSVRVERRPVESQAARP